MELKTTFPHLHYDFTLEHGQKIIALGSCFSEYIVQNMRELKFDCMSNSHGTLFSPVAIFNALLDIFKQRVFTKEDLEQQENGLFFSYQFHSSFRHSDPAVLLHQINHKLPLFHQYLRQADCLILTFGSAWAYQLLSTGKYVANCHKQPASFFAKKLLQPDLLLKTFGELIPALHAFNPNLQILLTLSPVRHLRDGFVENQRSKSILHYFIQELTEAFSYCSYFPSYEILMDDLRDYRFYKEDWVHPNELAQRYIWEYFSAAFFSPFTQNVIQRIQSVHRNLAHRPIVHDDQYLTFLQKTSGMISSLEMEMPFITWTEEKNQLQHLQRAH